MGYSDVLVSGHFKAMPDGRKIFFPRGIYGRGYLVPSDDTYERLRGQIRTYSIVSMGLGLGAFYLLGIPAVLVVAVAVIVFYQVWLRFLLRGLTPTEERMSLQERMAAQARAQSPSQLRGRVIMSLVLVAAGILMLVISPDQWMTALGCIVFFGILAIFYMRMLSLQRQA
jgi:hypothetical protein